MGECWLELVRATDLCFLGRLHDAASLLWIALVELIPRLLCPSASSIKILAALCPEIHNPTVAHLSLQPLALLSPPFFGFCWGNLQPACVQTSTYHRIFNPMQIYRIEIREDANNHKVIWCKYLSRSLCTAVDWTSPTDSSLWSSFCLYALPPLCVGGTEDGAVFGVDFTRSSSCRKLRWSPLEHCPSAFHWKKNSLFLFNTT